MQAMDAWQKLYDDFQVKAFCAIEIEWHLLQDGSPTPNNLRAQYLKHLEMSCAALPIHSIGSETGAGQVEAALNHTDNMAQLVADMAILQQIAYATATQMQLESCFKAKPFAEFHGNGLHVHVHLEDLAGQRLFWLEDDCQTTHNQTTYGQETYKLSSHLGFALAGLLAHMQRDLAIFAGSNAAMQRYAAGFNAPINASWGFNNRTTALRLPDNVGHVSGLEAILQQRSENQHSPNHSRRYKRIEHRVASAEADLSATLAAILSAIHYGITQQLPPPAPTHGNAHHLTYKTESFVK